ncbi:hypothetical protein ACFQY0_20715 [Haloferula chungangensis]|uniref:Uncharacterized protein n=1 Tax=Haloferula chungangensis TaxID=1048331 RepID=A0ABW2LCT4_9BACT
MKGLLLLPLTVLFFQFIGTAQCAQKSRYAILFEVFELGIPDPNLEFEMGLVIEGKWGKISVDRLSYWASIMKPTSLEETRIAAAYAGSKIPEVRMIAAWSVLKSFEIRRSDYPNDVTPVYAGEPLGSVKHRKFRAFFEQCLKQKGVR